MTLLKDKTFIAILLTLMGLISFTYIMIISVMALLIVNEIGSDKEVYITVVQYNVPEVNDVKSEQPSTKTSVAEPKEEPKVLAEKVEPKVEPVVEKPKEEPKKEVKSINDEDAYLLAQIINAEAKGEPYNGKVAVGNVVMNRVNHPDFPDTIKGVIFQKGQFSPVTSGSIYNKPSDESIKAAEEVLNGKQIVGEQALYFYNPDISTSDWIFSRKTIMDIGNHRFAH